MLPGRQILAISELDGGRLLFLEHFCLGDDARLSMVIVRACKGRLRWSLNVEHLIPEYAFDELRHLTSVFRLEVLGGEGILEAVLISLDLLFSSSYRDL